MKTILAISLALAVVLVSCNKEPADDPNAEFVITKNTSNGPVEVDTINWGDYVTFKAAHHSEMIVFYSGLPVYNYYKRKEVGGQDVGMPAYNGELQCRYIKSGTYTVVCVATNYGNWSKEGKTNVTEKVIVVLPKQ